MFFSPRLLLTCALSGLLACGAQAGARNRAEVQRRVACGGRFVGPGRGRTRTVLEGGGRGAKGAHARGIAVTAIAGYIED